MVEDRVIGRIGAHLKSLIYIIWGLAIGLAVLAGWIDWRSRRLPNWLTVSRRG